MPNSDTHARGRHAPLTEAAIRAVKPRSKPYKLRDTGGLILLIQPTGRRLWRQRCTVAGRETMLSLGGYPEVPLRDARERRDENRKLIAKGIDPVAKRRSERAVKADTFAAIAEEWLGQRKAKLTSLTHEKVRWLLLDLLGPYIGSQPIASIAAPDVLGALRRIEARGRLETAHRAKQCAGQVFRYAIATGRAQRDPTPDLRGALAPVVTTHRAAITDPKCIGELLRAIDGYRGQVAVEYALKLAPLLFVRPGELRGARWEEFTLTGDEPLWRICAERMKMREEHLVPLSAQAVALLSELRLLTGPNGYLFPSIRTAVRPISNNTINGALRRLGYAKDEMSAHGFRAMASTCLNERGFPPDVIELQLAHVERNKVRAAYNRAQRLDDRRKMMQQWADFLDGLRAGAMIAPS